MLGIIPARGGSKGVPRKNVRKIGGKPLIAHTIEAALATKGITRLVVSTEDEEIADVARAYGAEIPFMRPQELATDTSSVIDTYIYTIEQLKAEGEKVDEFAIMQATSPFRTTQDIDAAIELFHKKSADSVISVVETEHPLAWIKTMDGQGRLAHAVQGLDALKNRQAYPKYFLPQGAVYVFNYDLFRRTREYWHPNTYGYKMPAERSVDIDTPLDFEFATFLFEKMGR